MTELRRTDLLHPKLSYEIVGSLYSVYNILGPGHHEKYYQKAVSEEFQNRKIIFKRELRFPLEYKEKIIGSNYLDFLVEDKIILEIKKGDNFSKRHIDQVLGYLKLPGVKLAILANFSSRGIMFKRIINNG